MAGSTAIMAEKINIDAIIALVNAMPLEQLREINERATTRCDSMPFRFMDLPKEIRLMISDIVITPEMAEAHVKKRKCPTLFHINQEIRSEFIDFYYGRGTFKAKFYDPKEQSWDEVRDSRTIQAMVEGWSGCFLRQVTASRARSSAMEFASADAHSYSGIKTGVLWWVGAPTGKGAICSYWENTETPLEKAKRRKIASWTSLLSDLKKRRAGRGRVLVDGK